MDRADNLERTSLPIECPNPKCGAEGWIPINRLDRQLMCKECGARFYMDPIGRGMILGDRPANYKLDPLAIVEYKKRKPDLVDKLGARTKLFHRWWEALPERFRLYYRIASGSAGLFLLFLVYKWVTAPGPTLPLSLHDRTLYVASAVIAEDRSRLRAIAATGTSGDLMEWLDTERPPDWPRDKQKFQIEAVVGSQNPKRGLATSAAEIFFGPAPPPAPTPAPAPAPAPASSPPDSPEASPETPAPAEGSMEAPSTGEAPAQAGEAQDPPAEANSGEASAPPGEMEPPGGAEPGTSNDGAEAQPAPPTPPPPPPPPRPPGVTFRMYWVAGDDKRWLLDGTETLKHSPGYLKKHQPSPTPKRN